TIKVSEKGDRQVVDFIDNGSGIAPENSVMIFEKFSRVSDEAKAGGAGLGLAICREIMRRLGGEIDYLPQSNATGFRVVLPLAKTPAELEKM
ncbi:MAG: ATP-binding protein, partial [Pseudomonadota bacterium]